MKQVGEWLVDLRQVAAIRRGGDGNAVLLIGSHEVAVAELYENVRPAWEAWHSQTGGADHR